jgi:hypothetical protein
MIVKSVSIMAAAAGPILLGSPRCLAHDIQVHCLANSLRVPSRQTILLKSICHGRYVIMVLPLLKSFLQSNRPDSLLVIELFTVTVLIVC